MISGSPDDDDAVLEAELACALDLVRRARGAERNRLPCARELRRRESDAAADGVNEHASHLRATRACVTSASCAVMNASGIAAASVHESRSGTRATAPRR